MSGGARLVLVGVLSWAVSATAFQVDKQIIEVMGHLDAWDLEGARVALEPLAAQHADKPDVMYLRARFAFLRGRYDEAVDWIGKVHATQPSNKRLAATKQLYESTRAVVGDFKEVPSSKGHFVIAFKPGVDELLVPYADEALEQAYERLGELFRHRPKEPVRVEIYGHVENLADVSPLKASEIRTSGTIALCKYNRLMIVSPRALVYGYSWLDTLAHEYIHLLVTKRSRNQVPIWLHEGMAKFFENRWRETTNATLSPRSEDLLARALKKKKLIRFEAMSPSMAKLPSQEDTALAFAEVFMVMELLYEKGGMDAINQLLDAMRDGSSDREAVERVAQKQFRRFQREWKNYLYQRNLKLLPTHGEVGLLFRDEAKPKDELRSIEHEKARDLTYLGDRLAVRKRFKAAAKEYRKALVLAGGPNPLVSAKLANALLKQGKYSKVASVVTPAIELNPNHVLLYLYRGKARLRVGDAAKALVDLTQANRINPFDPELHGLLAEALTKLGRSEEADRERRFQRLVTAER